jgi:hypothetical protein
MANIQSQHKNWGATVEDTELYGADSHYLTAPGSANRDLVEISSSGVLQTTNTPSVVKIRVGSAGTPVNELDVVSGTAEMALGTTLRSKGAIVGNVGEHAKGATEFAQFLCDETAIGTIADKTGHYPATYGGTFACGTTGTSFPANLTSSLYFSIANGSYAEIPRFDCDWNDISISAWVCIDSAATDSTRWIFSNAYNTTAGFHLVWLGGTTVRFYANNQYASAIIPAKGTWFHITGTFSRTSGKVKCFVNGGTSYGETAVSGTVSTTSTNPPRIGSRPTTVNYNLEGSIADVRIFNRELRRSEIEALYNGGNGRTDSLSVMTGYSDKRWTEVKSYTATPTSTYSFTTTDSRLVAGTPIRYFFNGSLYYGLVQMRAGTTAYILGAPLNTSYPIQYLEAGSPDSLVSERFVLSGSYASGKTAGDVLESRLWRRSSAVCVGLSATHTTNDTGAAQPAVNVKLAGQATGVSTLNSANGPTLSSATWTPDMATASTSLVAVSPTYYSVSFGQAENLVLTTTGTNKNAVGLTVEALYVLK